MASTYIAINKTQEAKLLFEKCIKYSNDPEIILGSYINLGSIYSSFSQYKLSNIYLQKAKAICEKDNSKQQALVNVIINIGDNYVNNGEIDQAIYTYGEAKKISVKNNFYNLELIISDKLGTVFYNQKRNNEAF